MNNVPNESSSNVMLSCTEIRSYISLFDFEKFGVNPRVSFFFNSHLYKKWASCAKERIESLREIMLSLVS